jgi:hypothetical protein
VRARWQAQQILAQRFGRRFGFRHRQVRQALAVTGGEVLLARLHQARHQVG